MWAVTILAIVGLVVYLAIHIASFVCVDPREWIQPEWVTTVGFYALFGLVLMLANITESRRTKSAQDKGRVLPTENPLWFKPVIWLLVGYMLFNVFVVGFGVIRRGDPVNQGGGNYAVDPGHGRPPVPISEAEYHEIRRLGVRAGSGFFLGFYVAIAFDLIFTLTGQKCLKPPDGSAGSFSLFVILRRVTKRG
jgi:hypothetical protein